MIARWSDRNRWLLARVKARLSPQDSHQRWSPRRKIISVSALPSLSSSYVYFNHCSEPEQLCQSVTICDKPSIQTALTKCCDSRINRRRESVTMVTHIMVRWHSQSDVPYNMWYKLESACHVVYMDVGLPCGVTLWGYHVGLPCGVTMWGYNFY